MTDLLNRANVDIAINTLLDDLQPNDAIQPSDHNGLLKDILDTLSNGLSTTLRTGNTTGGFDIDITDGDNIQYNKGGSFVGVLDSLTLTGSRSWDFPDNSGTIALLSDITGGDNIANANLTLDADRILDYDGNSLTLDGDTILKGSATLSTTNNILSTNSANREIFKVTNEGQILGYNVNGTTLYGLSLNNTQLNNPGIELRNSNTANGTNASIDFKVGTGTTDWAQVKMVKYGFGDSGIELNTYGGAKLTVRKTDAIILGDTTIGSEKISLQDDTLIKASNNAEGTTGFKVTDFNNSNLLDIRNNGQIGYGGTYLNTAGHTFRNPNNESAIAKFLNADNTTSTEFTTNGGFNSYRPGTANKIFTLFYQGGVPNFRMFDSSNIAFIKFNTGSSSYMNVSGFAIGDSLSANPKALFQLYPPSANSFQQKFFANVTMTTTGRVNSSSAFGTAEKGFECFDTTLNKKFVWTGSAWEQITSV